MKESTILLQNGNAKPYTLHVFHNFDSCYCKLLEMINTDKVQKEYYVLNDFYKNEYMPFLPNITKYTIQVRDVTEWEIYSTEKHSLKTTKKIINFFDYIS